MSEIELIENASRHYGPRTWANAAAGHVTIALAVDYGSAGERLTHKAAKNRYLRLPLLTQDGQRRDPVENARDLYRRLRDLNISHPVINVAGNGIYSLSRHGWTQDEANEHVYRVLEKVHTHWANAPAPDSGGVIRTGIGRVFSGGQTGIDMAGLIAGHALGIPVTGHFPNGFIQRGTDKKDRTHTRDEVLEQIKSGARALIREGTPDPS